MALFIECPDKRYFNDAIMPLGWFVLANASVTNDALRSRLHLSLSDALLYFMSLISNATKSIRFHLFCWSLAQMTVRMVSTILSRFQAFYLLLVLLTINIFFSLKQVATSKDHLLYLVLDQLGGQLQGQDQKLHLCLGEKHPGRLSSCLPWHGHQHVGHDINKD